MPYGITVTCHPTEARILPIPPAETGTQFSDPGGMQGWVDLLREIGPAGNWTATCQSQLASPTPYRWATTQHHQQRHSDVNYPPVLTALPCHCARCLYKTLHGSVPTYRSQLVRVADLPGRRSLRSECTSRLQVPSVRLSTVAGRVFLVSGPNIWNNLPDNVASAVQLRLCQPFVSVRKNSLFPISFHDILLENS